MTRYRLETIQLSSGRWQAIVTSQDTGHRLWQSRPYLRKSEAGQAGWDWVYERRQEEQMAAMREAVAG